MCFSYRKTPYFCEKGGGGGSELRFSVLLLHEQFCVFSDDVVIFGLNSVDRRRFVFSSVFCSLLGFISDDYSFVVAFVIYLLTWISICIFRCTFRLSIDVSASLIFLILITVPVISFLL